MTKERKLVIHIPLVLKRSMGRPHATLQRTTKAASTRLLSRTEALRSRCAVPLGSSRSDNDGRREESRSGRKSSGEVFDLPNGSLAEAEARCTQVIVFSLYLRHRLLKRVVLRHGVEKLVAQDSLGPHCFLKLRVEVLHLCFKRCLSPVCHRVEAAPERFSSAMHFLVGFTRRSERRRLTASN